MLLVIQEPHLEVVPGAPAVVAGVTPCPDHAVAGDHQGDGVSPHGAAHCLHANLYLGKMLHAVLT